MYKIRIKTQIILKLSLEVSDMRKYLLMAILILFCFGVLPEYVITESSERVDRTAKEIQNHMISENANLVLPPCEEVEIVEDANCEIDKNTEDDKDETKISPWLKKKPKENESKEDIASETNLEKLPIEEKMINEHKRERANKEIPGTNKFRSINDVKEQNKSLSELRIIDNATVVFNEGIVNVKIID